MESPIQRSRLWKISFWKLYYSWYRHRRKDIYAKFYFENCIPHTDIDKKIFMHKFFLKIIFLIWTSTKDIDRKSSPIKSTRGTPAGWFYENTFGIAKGYLDWSPSMSSEAVEVPVDIFATLIDQATPLLDQASLSISYTRCLNILKTLLKDPP